MTEQEFEKLQKNSEIEVRKATFNKLQEKDLKFKIEYSLNKIKEFKLKFPNSTVSFSGGKDSSVLLHLVRSIYPNTIAVFSDTTIEHKEIYEIIKNTPNLVTKYPIKSQWNVWDEDGLPVFSKQISSKLNTILESKKTRIFGGSLFGYISSPGFSIPKKSIPFLDKTLFPYKISDLCCHYLKVATCGSNICLNEPSFIGTRAEESQNRRQAWLTLGCNTFEKGKEASRPISIWTEKDIDDYIIANDVPIASIYQLKGGWATRTGCKSCPFGINLEKRAFGFNRFEKLKDIDPEYYNEMINHKAFRLSLLLSQVVIENDEEYMKEFHIMKKQLDEWWNNFDNIRKIVNDYQTRVNITDEEKDAIIAQFKKKFFKTKKGEFFDAKKM